MRYLIIGGAGFIGTNLIGRLATNPDNEIVVIDNLSTSAPPKIPNITVMYADASNCSHLDAYVKCSDVVYFIAGSVGVRHVVSNPYDTMSNNLRLAISVMDAVKRHNKYVLFTSTSEVYGQHPVKNETENLSIGEPSNPRWGYASAKLATEFLITSSGCRYKIFRLFNVTGPGQVGDYGMVLPTFVQAALSGKDIVVYGDGTQVRSFCHVDDAISEMVLLEHHADNGVFNIGSTLPDNMVSIHELARLVKTELSSSSSIIQIPHIEAFGRDSGDIQHRIPDLTKTLRYTGYIPTKSLRNIVQEIANDQLSY